MMRNADPAVGNQTKGTPSDIGGTWPATGAWVCRTSATLSSESRSGGGDGVHSGTFQARPEPVLGGYTYTWRAEIVEDNAVQEVQHLERMLPGAGSTKVGPISPRRLARSGIQAAKTQGHKHLVAAVKRELEERYGKVQEMHVLFREAQSLPWQGPQRAPWYDRLSGRLAAMLGRGQSGLLAD